MALVEWKEDYSVSVSIFDDQHKKLFEIINNLHEAMKKGASNVVIPGILDELYNYTQKHFTNEEELFTKYNYPEIEYQKNAHMTFLNKISEFKNDFESGKLGLSIEIISFLNDWLINHIKGADKKYGKFFNDLGIK
ncbi:MAG: bacteriohemerythrin [Exilispira sp.]